MGVCSSPQVNHPSVTQGAVYDVGFGALEILLWIRAAKYVSVTAAKNRS